MIDRLNQINWVALGQPQIKDFLVRAISSDQQVRTDALNHLKDAIAPWELLDGYGQTSDLMRVSISPVPEIVIPFLVEMLKTQETQEKVFLLEILYDLCRYELVDNAFIAHDELDRYMIWARKIRDAVGSNLELYETLLKHPSHDVRQSASNLIRLLKSDHSDEM